MELNQFLNKKIFGEVFMPDNFNVADEIKKLKQLLDDEIITQEEFENQKKKLLNNNVPNEQHFYGPGANAQTRQYIINTNKVKKKWYQTELFLIVLVIIGFLFFVYFWLKGSNINIRDIFV